MHLMESVIDFVKVNSRCRKCEVITVEDPGDGDLVEIYASYIKSPTILVSGRIFIDAKYMSRDESLVVMSGIGNELIKEQYLQSHDVEGLEVGESIISGFKFDPIYDSQSEQIIGTSVVFVSEQDFGGTFPKWFTKKFSPKAIHDFYDEVVLAARKIVINI